MFDGERDLLILVFEMFRDEHYRFHGFDEGEGKTVVGYYNVSKINPAEPDLRIYYSDQDRRGAEYLAMWMKTSKTGRKYLIGNVNGVCYIGLINFNRLSESDPYLNIYYVIKTSKKENERN